MTSQSETCGRSQDLVRVGLVDWGQKLGKLLGILGKGSKVEGKHIFQALQEMVKYLILGKPFEADLGFPRVSCPFLGQVLGCLNQFFFCRVPVTFC